MNGESQFQVQPAYVQKTSNKKRLVIIFLVVLVLVVAALGALYLLGSPKHPPAQQPTNPVPTETISVTPATTSAQLSPTPIATPSSAVSLTTLKVSVLNGSGTPGAASQVASALKTAGFTNITTGNAAAFTYTGITIHVKKRDDLSAVQKAVTDASPNTKIITGVDPTISTDVEVIVGK